MATRLSDSLSSVMDIPFFTVDEVIAFHEIQISLFGGDPLIRDHGLLSSAVATPMQMFGGEFVHESIFEMAAAYLFHICNNHPFVDGNKRTAAMTALVFLELNNISCTATNDQIVELTLQAACSKITKKEITLFFQDFSERI